MPIETLDDIIEQVADKIGIYGAHDSACRENRPCRVCFTSDFRDRLKAAFEIEKILYPSEVPR